MKLLFLGLVPIVLFWAFEEKYGTMWGLIVAIIWALGECVYEYAKTKTVDRITLLSTGLVVGLGGMSALLDNSIIFKFQPVIMEVVFAGVLFASSFSEEPFLLKMMKKTRPEVFQHPDPAVRQRLEFILGRMTRNLILLLLVHSTVLTYFALRGTTGQWAFWKGVGFNVFLLLWGGFEFVWIKRQTKNARV